MSEDGALFDARFDDGEPFRDTPEPGGISLESALRDFGPAALDDLIPRIRVLARALDAAHRRGVVHGAINPSKIIITDEGTSLIRGKSSHAPYIAPEVAAGEAPTAASDVFSLAAVSYEWLFGKRIDGPAHRPISVKAMPEVDRAALAKAFTRALAATPEVRFATCMDFCDALAAAAVPELPLAIGNARDDEDELDAVGPFVAENPAVEPEVPVVLATSDQPAPNVDDIKITAEETNQTAGQPDFDAIVPPPPVVPAPVPSWNPPAATRSSESQRFGGAALIVAALVGAMFGFAGGYMARPRALQSGAAETFAPQPSVEAPATKPVDAAPNVPPANASKEIAKAPAKTAAAKEAVSTGRLLVRSEPSGAAVSMDGVEKGVTPLALRDVEFGTRVITVAQRGYTTETRRVAISASRPSRTMDVKLAATKVAAPKPAAPKRSEGGRSEAGTTGGLIVDSRPSGAAVTINGKASGTTPVTIDDLAPGEYRLVMTRPGFRNFATTVRVVAGERVRAAYSLTAQEQE